MDDPQSIGQQISANFPDVLNSPEFSNEKLWLTFYISGGPAVLRNLVQEMKTRGWVNTQDWEGGWFYPKVESPKTFFDVLQACLLAEELCERNGAVIDYIDADTSPDVFQSACVELYRAPSTASASGQTAGMADDRSRDWTTAGGVWVILVTGFAALGYGSGGFFDGSPVNTALGVLVILLTLGGAFALNRFIALHGDEIGEARFDTRNRDEDQS